MDVEMKPITLGNLAGGALYDLFNVEFDRVMDNIKDLNTVVATKRKIEITITLNPYEDRSGAEISVGCKSTLAGSPPIPSRIFIVQGKGKKFQAFAQDDHPELGFVDQEKEEVND